jgi:hypothetical protein
MARQLSAREWTILLLAAPFLLFVAYIVFVEIIIIVLALL